VQLGELQSQFERFETRNATILAISVDPPDDSLAMIQRLGLKFDLASDPNQRVVQMFRVQNPDTRELALHAVYIIDSAGEVFYRKVGKRRPVSAELIDAIDAHQGRYPQTDVVEWSRSQLNVAYPTNNFQALIEVSAVTALPASVDRIAYDEVMSLLRERRSDDAVFAFRRLISVSPAADRQALFATAAWLTRSQFFSDKPEALELGAQLQSRVARVQELRQQHEDTTDDNSKDELLHQLARARAGLAATRADVERNAQRWNLRYAKTTLRSYRELARAGRPVDS